MNKYLRKIYELEIPFPDAAAGFTEKEISKLEIVLDIRITGDLREFFLNLAKNDGGIFGKNEVFLVPYSFDSLSELKQYNIESKEFVVGTITELNQDSKNLDGFFTIGADDFGTYFLLTSSEEPDRVYYCSHKIHDYSSRFQNFLIHRAKPDYENWRDEFHGSWIVFVIKRLLTPRSLRLVRQINRSKLFN